MPLCAYSTSQLDVLNLTAIRTALGSLGTQRQHNNTTICELHRHMVHHGVMLFHAHENLLQHVGLDRAWLNPLHRPQTPSSCNSQIGRSCNFPRGARKDCLKNWHHQLHYVALPSQKCNYSKFSITRSWPNSVKNGLHKKWAYKIESIIRSRVNS
jgi:hypothetical protein